MAIEIGMRVRVISNEQVRRALDEGYTGLQARARITDNADRIQSEDTIHCNGWEPIAMGEEGVIVPQFPNDGGAATLLWSDGTILVRRDNGTLFSVWPELVTVV